MKKYKSILAASIAAFFVTGCSHLDFSSNDGIEISTTNEQSKIFNSLIQSINSDGEVILISGNLFNVTNNDIRNSLLGNSQLFSSALYMESLSFIIRNLYPTTEEAINRFIAEQASFAAKENKSNLIFLNEDIENYLSLYRATKENYVYTKSELIAFYDANYDKSIYPNIEDVPMIEDEFLFQQLRDPSTLNVIYKKVLKDNHENIKFNQADIPNLDFSKIFNSMREDSFSFNISKTQTKILNTLDNSTEILTIGANSLTLKDIKESILIVESPEFLYNFILAHSIIDSSHSVYVEHHIETLTALWQKKYSDFNPLSKEDQFHVALISALYNNLSSKSNFDELLLEFHDSRISDEGYFYKSMPFEEIPKVDLGYEYILFNDLIALALSGAEKTVDFKDFNFLDSNIIKLVEEYPKTAH